MLPYPNTIFLTGATGYVGGSLLVSLVRTYSLAKITALVRNPEDLSAVSGVGHSVHAILGSHVDKELIIEEVSKAELVIQLSNPDDLLFIQSIVAGLKLHKERTGNRPLYFHATGTLTYADKITGELQREYVPWDDTEKPRLRDMVDIDAPHRIVDLEAIKVHEENIADVHLICPPTVYGVGTGPVRRTSTFIPYAMRAALKWRYAGYVGKGTNVWSNIHVGDLVRAILFIINHALQIRRQKSEESHGNERDGFDNFYFTSSGEHMWGSVIAEMGRVMFQRGLLDTPIAKNVPIESDQKLSWATGTNCRVQSTRLKALGWVPQEKGIIDTLEEDVDASLETIQSKLKPNF